jgi:hypothetical protein
MGKELSAVIGVHGVARGTRVCRAIKRKAEFQSRRSAGTSKSERLVEHSICPSAVYSRSIVACRTTSKRRRQRAAVDDCMADVVTEARRHQHTGRPEQPRSSSVSAARASCSCSYGFR